MMPSLTIKMFDSATPALQKMRRCLTPAEVRRAVGAACVRLTQAHLHSMGPNAQGWPSTGFYAGAARGTAWNGTATGLVIEIDNADRPGAMAHRFTGGTITMKDHLLAIPARQEFAGSYSPTQFTNLRFVMFGKGGAKALVIGTGGTDKINFATGKEKAVKGAGKKTAGMVAFWLVEQVTQDANHGVIPTDDEYVSTAVTAISRLTVKGGAK